MDSHIEGRPDDSSATLPSIGGPRWFGPERQPFVIRIEQPLTFDEMVAALYGTVQPGDIRADEDLCGSVVVTLLIEGLPALQARAAQLRRDEERGVIESPAFLALCRKRVAALVGH
jgi:hypothetical protein